MHLVLLLLIVPVYSEINTSSELNCDFSTDCRWRNATDDSGEWVLTNKLQVDTTHSIMPMTGNDGGANLKYWYYKTGQTSQLDICIRQPPGSKEPTSLRCYDGISSTHAQQWIFRIIELPPSSQPFEILFRATFYPPTDVIALDDIVFDAALCVQQVEVPLRSTRAAPPIIGFRDWQLLREKIANDGANQGAGGGFADDNPSLIPSSPFQSFDTRVDESPQSIIQLDTESPRRVVNFAAPILEPTKVTPPPAPRVGNQFKSMCPAIDCSFDDSSICNFLTSATASPQEKSLKEWRLSSQGILNTLTGIPHDLGKEGSFLFAGGEEVSPRDTFVLSTKTPFDIKESSRLDFFVYQAGVKGRLSVCFNTIENCELVLEGNNITNDPRKWKNYYVPITTNTHAIHFVADQLHKNYAIGIDSIQLLNKYGTSSAAC